MNSADRDKGVEVLLRAMPWVLRDVPGARLEIAGDGDDRKRLEQIAIDRAIAGRINFLGDLRDDTLSDAYARASIFALPSSKEGFGIVFLEAMAHGLPVVAARAGATPEVVHDGVTGILVPPDDPASLASALSGLLLIPEEHAAMGAAGLRRVEEHFLYSHFAARWHRWFAAVAPEAISIARHRAEFVSSNHPA
jgi:glycosyltransferase involved in cell wall biosynthesis